jgi:hypothetical protein
MQTFNEHAPDRMLARKIVLDLNPLLLPVKLRVVLSIEQACSPY